MKKIFTLFMGGVLGLGVNANAQKVSVWAEDAESVTTPALPANWTEVTSATKSWKSHNGTISFANTPGWAIPAHTNYLVIDDWNNDDANNPSILVTPQIDLTTHTGAWLKFSYYFVKASYTGGSPAENFIIKASKDGGTTWTDIATPAASNNAWTEMYIDLSAYDGEADVRLGFAYYDGAGKLICAAVDDIEVFIPAAIDIAVKSVKMPFLYDTTKIAVANTPVKATLMNMGSDTIKSVDLSYAIDGGTAVAQTFSGLTLNPFTSTEVTFSTTVGSVSVASHNLLVEATQANGTPDGNTADNIVNAVFLGASKAIERNGIIEEFTSSTCAPCASFNSYFDPLIEANNVNTPESRFNIIKYQMNWPSPGNDASYNQHGVSRRSYYGVSGIPDHYTNGMNGTAGDQAEIDASKEGMAFADITGSYTISDDSGWVNVAVTPYFNVTRNLKVYIGIIEKDYYNEAATTTQKHYIHVMRRMFPNGSGNSVSATSDNTAINYNYNAALPSGDVKQNNYNLWTHPKNTNIVVFVQDDASKQVLQSKVIEAQWPLSIAEQTSGVARVALYPNPASNQTTVGFDLAKATDVNVEIVDAIGRVVYTAASQHAAGFTEIKLNTANLVNGTYSVRINANNNTIVKRLAVVK